MSIELMRKIDYWLGIPLCFISSVWFKLISVFIQTRQKNSDSNQKRTLVIGLSEMGSMVLAQASLKKLAKNSTLYFVTFKKNKPALDLLGVIPTENIFTLETNNILTFTRESLNFFIWSRKNNITTVVDLELFSRFSALLGAYSGAKNHIAFYAYHTEGLYRGTFFTHPVAYNPHIHISKNFMSLAYAAGITLIDKTQLPLSKEFFSAQDVAITKVHITDSQKQQLRHIICQYYPQFDQQRIILINSEGGDLLPMRNWGQDKFYQLICLILEKDKQRVVLLTGSADEHHSIEQLKQRVNHSRCINFAGAVSLPQLLVLYELSRFMVSNDSGPNHFASLTNMRTYTLFGPETPELYGSLGNTVNIYKNLACSPCVTAANQRKTACSDNTCMQKISALEVYQIINNIEK